jgi:hypothetical protein
MVVLAARLGVLVVAAALVFYAGSCVNLSPPGGATHDGGTGFVAHVQNGKGCALPGDCQSGFCSDGFCCKEACDAQCFTCAKPGNEGFCMPSEVGSNPRMLCPDEKAMGCGRNGTCDGAGTCQTYPVGTVCQDASCVTHQVVLASRCTADGLCAGGTMQSCSPFLCDTGAKCLTQCVMDVDCENGHKCVAGSCGKKALGTVCGDAAECDSNFCAQGVCCATNCAGGCLSCALKGNEGACTAVPAGMPSDSCKASDASTCGLDGKCDGAGACSNFLLGTACSAASCTSATFRSVGTCDGKTHCQVPVAATCGGYTCGTATACRTTCTTDADCASPSVCGQASCGGLSAQYFRQTNFTDLAISRTDATINFNWGGGSPSPQLNVDNFSVRWRGKLTARFSEMYTFYAATDDGERLFIRGVNVIDRFIRKASIPEDVTTPIMLIAGKPVDIVLEYFENGGDASAALSWSSASEPKAIIPTSALAPQ